MTRPGLGLEEFQTLGARAAATPTQTALIETETGRSLTYGELNAAVSSVADELQRRWPETNRVGTLFEPALPFVIAFHAARRLGWTVVALDTRLSTESVNTRIAQADVDRVLTEKGTTNADMTAVSAPVTEVDALLAESDSLTQSEGDMSASSDVHSRLESTDSETALILFTSGTTGEQKGVRLTERNLHSSAVASAFRLGVTPDDCWLCCLPVYHMGGIAPVIRTTLYGTTLVTQRSFETAETARILTDYDITGVSFVPTQLRRLVDADAPLSALNTVLVGGAPTPDSLRKQALAADVPIHPTYGMTETASQIATALPDEVRAYPGTVGHPLYGATITILSDGEPAKPGDNGEIVVSGPMVTPGYLNGTGESFSEWGLHTGDVGYRDSDGRLWVVGRRDDHIQTGGELVAPQEVCDVLSTHPGVYETTVVGIPDEEWGERVGALVVSDGDVTATALRRYCRDRLPGYKCPKQVAFADALPRTVSGTVDREAVRELLQTAR